MNIVWVNGCFDLLHKGHLELLKFAKSKGDLLYVGIDSDARIRNRKGINRPIQNENTRFEILNSLEYVDKVMVYDTDYQLECLIQDFEPKLMVLGSDYVNKPILGSQFCEKITFFDRLEDYSTTSTIEKINNSL
jgi:D-beta-D-heptose 7-phosphate kinase/D-beta-D-heptose 1-phosphate adenosyltransferase